MVGKNSKKSWNIVKVFNQNASDWTLSTRNWRSGWDSNPRYRCRYTWFRVRAVITTSIPLRIYLKAFSSFLPVEWLWMEPEKSPEKGEKTRRERQKILNCESLKSPYKSRVPRRWGTEWRFWFRVSPVMTTSIPLRIADAAKLRRYYNSRQGKNQARIFLLHKSLACLTPFFVL